MERLEKITGIRNEIEAMCLRGELEDRGIPHVIQSHYDLAYDGLFQYHGVWGHVEAPGRYRDEILQLLEAIRQRPAEPSGEPYDGEGEEEAG